MSEKRPTAAKKSPVPLRARKPVGTVRPRRRSGIRWARALFLLVVLGAGLGLAGAVGFFWYFGRDLPSVEALRDYRPPQITRVLDRHRKLVGEIFVERRTVVPMERIPRVLVISVLAAEDADFYAHEGFDYVAILRALARDALAGRAVQGASTITQQVVKLMLLSPERTIARKARELILARTLERELTKDEILHLYLNHINFGHGRYGVQEAARYYFGKDVSKLDLAEATMIAGIPQAPARLSPRTHPEANRRRQLYVLDQLEKKRELYWPDLPAEALAWARDKQVKLAPAPEANERAPEILAMAREVLIEQVGEAAFGAGGYTVHTTIDLGLQEQVRRVVREGLEEIDVRQGFRGPLDRRNRDKKVPSPIETLRMGRTYDAVVTGVDDATGTIDLDVGGHPAVASLESAARYNPKNVPPSRFAPEGARVPVSILRLAESNERNARAEARIELGPEAAAVVIDPRTRDVLAMVGGYETSAGFNRALKATRQPGSTFKPIVYALGVRSRAFTPASLVIDAPAVYDQWQPKNYETWRHEGPVRLRDALARSINMVAVRVIERLGPAEVARFAKELGITTDLEPSLALALGASDVRPIELVNAYATFAAGGRFAPYRVVRKIEGPGGKDIPLAGAVRAREVMTPSEAFLVTSMLESVVRDGTAKAALKLGRPAAGKTGTSNAARDAWFVGYTPNVVAGVWIGFDDRRPLGAKESGGKTALPIWMNVIRAAEEGRPPVTFPIPTGVVTARIEPKTGALAYDGMPGAIEEYFLEGTLPSETARAPDVVDPNSYLMEQFATGGAEPAP